MHRLALPTLVLISLLVEPARASSPRPFGGAKALHCKFTRDVFVTEGQPVTDTKGDSWLIIEDLVFESPDFPDKGRAKITTGDPYTKRPIKNSRDVRYESGESTLSFDDVAIYNAEDSIGDYPVVRLSSGYGRRHKDNPARSYGSVEMGWCRQGLEEK